MKVSLPRLRWAPKLKRAKLWQLYQTDARGLIDETLIDEVGLTLLARCQSIIRVTEAQEVICPRCQAVIVCPEARWSKQCPIRCQRCDWQATYGQWRHSWRHQDLQGGNAMAAFRAYVEQYPQAKSPQARMLLIDRLINTYHWSIRRQRHHGPAAKQLLQGSTETVLAFLDKLSNDRPGRDDSGGD